MKIGVFGDSYADKGYASQKEPCIWYSFLQRKYGHVVDCYGEGGSSILFSADLINKHAQNYDLVIWCLTTPGRFSLPNKVDNRTYHVTTAADQCVINDVEIQKKHQVCIEYLKYIFDWDSENLIGQSLVEHLSTVHKNIMVVPCFPPPLSAKFNLYSLCEQEANEFFPGKSIPEIYKTYMDLRPGHISIDNQITLADLIQLNLQPGVFQTSYDNFKKPSQTVENYFLPR
jgi:hypothetical protein